MANFLKKHGLKNNKYLKKQYIHYGKVIVVIVFSNKNDCFLK
jgi:hypothetical protein